MSTIEKPSAERAIAVVVASFNAKVTGLLNQGCRQALIDQGWSEQHLAEFSVPGAWELPLACRQLAESGRYVAVIALGAVIRGETAHFDFISAECARGLMQVSLDSGVPVAFGVLTAEDGAQAMERADPSRKDKGREAALAVLSMIDFMAETSHER